MAAVSNGRALEGRVAVVTGASRGIGAAIASRFGAAGAAVAVSARTESETDERLPGTIHDTVAGITAAGGRAIAVRADLTSADDRRRLVETAERELGPIDVLVNNAAVTWFIPVAEFPRRRLDVMFEVQVKAPFELAQLVLPGMRERKRGWILNISSGAARHPQGPPFQRRAGGTVYGMVKASIERFSTGLASEVYEDGIAVNALSPSRVVATPGVVIHRLIPPGAEDRAEPVEVMAEAALALCSGDPRTLTGRVTYSQAILDELGLKKDAAG
jgi:NAD(P)-dependent dehydrogenase (short-subunit alcohol dehydrogenase family)